MNNNPPEKLNLSETTVKSLREQNIKVKIYHSRSVTTIQDGKTKQAIVPKSEIYRLKREKIPYVVSPNSGVTEVRVNYNNNEYLGRAVCSKTDSFCYRRAVKICLGRLELVKGSN